MSSRKRKIFVAFLACAALVIVVTTHAHNAGYDVASPGVPAAAITINGAEGGGEWTGAASVALSDYSDPMTPGNPLSGNLKALHKADGVYLLINISDTSSSPDDAVQIRFDINHNGSVSPEATDWGAEVRRSGQAIWGAANVDSAGWAPVPGGTAGVTSSSAAWVVEFRLPTGAPSNLVISGANVGIHVQLYDIDQAFSPESAKYTQWPRPTIADLNLLLAEKPNLWGNYLFNPATTFPNVAVTGVRRGGGVGSSEYYTISHTQDNTFQITVNNPGGTAINDANGVRLNLYLGAVGLGEPFHRLDAVGTIDGDCAAPWNPNASLPQSDVCSGAVSLPDVETIPNNTLVTNTAKYTIKNGATRVGGSTITVNGGATNDVNVVTWNTTAGQDPKFDFMTVNSVTYDRKHQCMRAEALVPNDPNLADNTRQVNMNFECMGEGGGAKFMFGLGAGAFASYVSSVGKDMFLHVSRRNMSPQLGWGFKLSDPNGQIRQVKDDIFIANIKGTQSIGAVLDLVAPRAEALGRTLKENLFVPAKAGGRQKNARIPSGDAPVYVKVNPGSTLLVANFAFHHNEDRQWVDVDGEGKLLPQNGPAGLSNEWLKKVLGQISQFKLLLSPTSPLGSLVGSFDNFKTSFLIAEGAQLRVPAGAQYLALGINDAIGLYGDNTGTGFRVKVVERAPGTIVSNQNDFSLIPAAYAQAASQPKPDRRAVVPLGEVMPTICLNGYENTKQTQLVSGQKRELFRYIGNVCWGIVNVFPPNRSEKPDQGDPFREGGGGGGCGAGENAGSILFPLFFATVGLGVIGSLARRRRQK